MVYFVSVFSLGNICVTDAYMKTKKSIIIPFFKQDVTLLFEYYIQAKQWCSGCSGTVLSQQEGSRFEPLGQLGLFRVEFACASCAFVGFLRVLSFPPTIQRRAD